MLMLSALFCPSPMSGSPVCQCMCHSIPCVGITQTCQQPTCQPVSGLPTIFFRIRAWGMQDMLSLVLRMLSLVLRKLSSGDGLMVGWKCWRRCCGWANADTCVCVGELWSGYWRSKNWGAGESGVRMHSMSSLSVYGCIHCLCLDA